MSKMVDLTFLENFTKGDKKKMDRYIGIYLKTAPGSFMEIEQNINTKDWERVRITAHSLKPQAEFMGIVGLKAILIEIEESVNNKAYPTLKSLYDKAYEVHKQSEIFLRDYIENE